MHDIDLVYNRYNSLTPEKKEELKDSKEWTKIKL